MTTTSAYQAELKARGFTADAAQLQGLAALQRCEDEWIAYKARRSKIMASVTSATWNSSKQISR